MQFFKVGDRVINLALVTDVNYKVTERENGPFLETTISFSSDNFIVLIGDQARVVWELFAALGLGLAIFKGPHHDDK